MGLAMHLTGVALLLAEHEIGSLAKSLIFLYAAGALGHTGWFVNVRLVTALAILPFAQPLDTGTYYFEAVYVFVSPEPTLSILRMAVLIGVTVSAARHWPERTARHARILAVMAFITANLCALVGSLFGDVIGETLWGPLREGQPDGMDWDDWWEIVDAYHATAFTISETAFSVLWALALAAMIAWGGVQRPSRAFQHRAHLCGDPRLYPAVRELWEGAVGLRDRRSCRDPACLGHVAAQSLDHRQCPRRAVLSRAAPQRI